METMEINRLFGGIYNNRRVLVTGHTGFKGSWLSYWLQQMGAKVSGISLAPPTQPNHFDLLKFDINSYIQNINSFIEIQKVIQKIEPEIIFHLAAQPLVRLSYLEPLNTLATNIIGTANILEAARSLADLKAMVVITSDKCYDNKEWIWGYRENESMGGEDVYSASKGCAEIITSAYRNSFFNNHGSALIASARAGNVIGGGDWAKDRILTDIVTSASRSERVFLRFPNATRPWQYVLEPLSGYLTLGWKLLEGKQMAAEAWNFGPDDESNVTVLNLVDEASKHWNKIKYGFDQGTHPHEAGYLMLDSSKAVKLIHWRPVWDFKTTVYHTVDWYKAYYETGKLLTQNVLRTYIADAKKKQIPWSLT
jgi:CDP-glucose 4,6-dehydratase